MMVSVGWLLAAALTGFMIGGVTSVKEEDTRRQYLKKLELLIVEAYICLKHTEAAEGIIDSTCTAARLDTQILKREKLLIGLWTRSGQTDRVHDLFPSTRAPSDRQKAVEKYNDGEI